VRHGESAGNVARDAAHQAGLERIDVRDRDVDVPLSERGLQQAESLGTWFAELAADDRPDVVITSPYLRARDTAAAVARAGGLAGSTTMATSDERLREREFGILDRLTSTGIRELFPEQAELRRQVGKFYHRPPGGESWCDVILRLRSALDTMVLHYAGRRILIVTHQVVILCLRYLMENMTEADILGIDAQGDVANCSVTEYALGQGAGPTQAPALIRYNSISHLKHTGAAVTREPDKARAPR